MLEEIEDVDIPVVMVERLVLVDLEHVCARALGEHFAGVVQIVQAGELPLLIPDDVVMRRVQRARGSVVCKRRFSGFRAAFDEINRRNRHCRKRYRYQIATINRLRGERFAV